MYPVDDLQMVHSLPLELPPDAVAARPEQHLVLRALPHLKMQGPDAVHSDLEDRRLKRHLFLLNSGRHHQLQFIVSLDPLVFFDVDVD